jgi:hypothetical protein
MTGTVGHADRICGDSISGNRRRTEELSVAPDDVIRAYLHRSRDALIWKLDSLSEYDLRRPLTPTGTNLLGLIKHTASVTADYLGAVFGRPFEREMPWLGEDAEPNADLWVTADESREEIVQLWHDAWSHADATLDALPLDATGEVPWWPSERNPVTLHQIAVHLIAELHRHAGHADIVREQIDGAAGMLPTADNLPAVDAGWWPSYVERVESAARAAGALG